MKHEVIGWNDALRLENFYLYDMEAQTGQAGKITYTKNFHASDIRLNVNSKDSVLLNHNEQCNINIEYAETNLHTDPAGNAVR